MKFFQIISPNTNIDFIGKFKLFVVISVVTVSAVIIGLLTKGFNFGIDFTGGTVVQVAFAQPTSAEEIRKLVHDLDAPDASVVAVGDKNLEYMITTRLVKDGGVNTLDKRLIAKVGADKATIRQVDVVGPKVGAELKTAALQSLFYSVILIMIYIWLRFDFRFAPGATIAMIHDMILAAGFYIFTGREFSIVSVAALLTIAGFSVNDTIVIYDRVRDLLKQAGDATPLPQVINRAINLTLSRTFLTNGLTFLSILPIAIFCDGEIADFADAMLIGMFVGTYSTIYIAAPATIYVQRYFDQKKKAGTIGKPLASRA